MPIISSDYEGSAQYVFSARGTNVVLKSNVVYNYTGGGGAFLMDMPYCRLLVGGWIFSGTYGIELTAGISSTIEVADTGFVSGNITGIDASGVTGELRISNHGVIEGFYAIDGEGARGRINVFNYGVIQTPIELAIAVRTGTGNDVVNNAGTMAGDIWTGAGNDTIDLHLGMFDGRIFGGRGDDTYALTGDQQVTEYGDEGIDTVVSYGDYILSANLENLELLGFGRIGRGNGQDNAISGNDLGNTLSGGRGDDTIRAGVGDDMLRGGDGADYIESLAGEDVLNGGDGDDTLSVGVDIAQLIGGAGLDVAVFLLNDAAITADLSLAKNQVTGGVAGLHKLSSIEGIWGSQFDDTLTGSAAANDLFGYLGDDVIKGMNGDDVIEGFTGADRLDGGIGVDTLSYAFSSAAVTINLLTSVASGGDATGDVIAGFENVRGGLLNDTLTGSADSNVMEGNEGADVIDGGGGTDILDGGAGNDMLTGGSARDVFRFTDTTYRRLSPPASFAFGSDTITDF